MKRLVEGAAALGLGVAKLSLPRPQLGVSPAKLGVALTQGTVAGTNLRLPRAQQGVPRLQDGIPGPQVLGLHLGDLILGRRDALDGRREAALVAERGLGRLPRTRLRGEPARERVPLARDSLQFPLARGVTFLLVGCAGALLRFQRVPNRPETGARSSPLGVSS